MKDKNLYFFDEKTGNLIVFDGESARELQHVGGIYIHGIVGAERTVSIAEPLDAKAFKKLFSKSMSKRKYRTTEAKRQIIKDMVANGKNSGEIAEAVGLDLGQVNKVVLELRGVKSTSNAGCP